jgi:hypothetical protein
MTLEEFDLVCGQIWDICRPPKDSIFVVPPEALKFFGPVAQLGTHRPRTAGIEGSNPFRSTKIVPETGNTGACNPARPAPVGRKYGDFDFGD